MPIYICREYANLCRMPILPLLVSCDITTGVLRSLPFGGMVSCDITTGVLRSLPFDGMVSCDINSLACRMKMREKKNDIY